MAGGVAGLLHGYALAAAIVGAEAAPLYAYFAGLAGVQSSIALAAFGAAKWLAARRPHLPVQRIMGAAVGVAGLLWLAAANCPVGGDSGGAGAGCGDGRASVRDCRTDHRCRR